MSEVRQELESELRLMKEVIIPIVQDMYNHLSSKKRLNWRQQVKLFDYEDMLKEAEVVTKLLEKVLEK